MSLQEFCRSLTVDALPDIAEDATVTVDLATKIGNLCKGIRRQVKCADRVSIPFIEEAFRNVNIVADKLTQNDMEDIPDGIMNCFANELYAKPFNQLHQSERSIIAVLSVYILI